jgi:hypothetical protein
MRTTVDIPDDLFRRVKAQAALEGVPLRQVVERALRKEVLMPERPPRRVGFPLHRSARPGALSSDTVRDIEDAATTLEDRSRARPL